ncbi:unnamed protein product [Orchesella dallaii]|uniref:Uncharacterized protein n=1 Tax=Orchesella dallaii TaxID=48710 RepID=A0ABP1RS85_9HEXA
MAVSHAVFKQNVTQKMNSINQYIQLEAELLKKYKAPSVNRLDGLQLFFYLIQFGNLIPYIGLMACLYWDLDGPFWVLEDFAPNSIEREPLTVLLFLLIRLLLLLPGLLEATRTIMGCVMRGYSATKDSAALGFGILEPPMYFLFLAGAVLESIGGLVFFLPRIKVMGEAIQLLPKQKQLEMMKGFIGLRNKESKIAIKKSLAVKPLKFSYGDFQPMGRKFVVSLFEKGLETTINLIILFQLD